MQLIPRRRLATRPLPAVVYSTVTTVPDFAPGKNSLFGAPLLAKSRLKFQIRVYFQHLMTVAFDIQQPTIEDHLQNQEQHLWL
jgi:hypothetical protein